MTNAELAVRYHVCHRTIARWRKNCGNVECPLSVGEYIINRATKLEILKAVIAEIKGMHRDSVESYKQKKKKP